MFTEKDLRNLEELFLLLQKSAEIEREDELLLERVLEHLKEVIDAP